LLTTRREFVKQAGVAGTAALVGPDLDIATFLAAQQPDAALPAPFPTLSPRTRGWLHFLWEKATTPDDWSRSGTPHPWWDRYSVPGVQSYPRFDLQFSSYALLLMADQTPAWREAYSRILDGLADRFRTYWGAIDWLTQVGDDPERKNYSAAEMGLLRPDLRGNYNRVGWTANGVQPWGLQPDPIGADGFLFFRGWFNLLLSIYKYVSGDGKWERPFTVTGYGDREFEWDHARIADLLERQYRQRPEGPHCENTKVWFFCNSAAALGLYLYDRLHGTGKHRAVENWLEYARRNYMSVSRSGALEWITRFYDPLVNFKLNVGPQGGADVAFLLLPQQRELATFLYEAAATALGWRNPGLAAPSTLGLVLAHQFGDADAEARLRAAAERASDPRVFGEHGEKFGWFFGLNEPYPRGQTSAMMMVAEVGQPGAWSRAFEAPHTSKFTAPTVEGLDFPSVGVHQAWNDTATSTLHVGTYAPIPDRRGRDTSWRVSALPNPRAVSIRCDGEPFTRFEVVGRDTIRLDTTIENRQYQILTNYRGGARADRGRAPAAGVAAAGAPDAPQTADPRDVRRAARILLTGAGPTCPCCTA
jgi:hypothetical protein